MSDMVTIRGIRYRVDELDKFGLSPADVEEPAEGAAPDTEEPAEDAAPDTEEPAEDAAPDTEEPAEAKDAPARANKARHASNK